MDQLCIDRGTLLDNPSVKTLENPELHTIHCLIDIKRCIDSGFTILKPPSTPGGLYSVQYQLGKEGTQLAIKAMEQARANGVKSGFSMNVTGIDDGTPELKCITVPGVMATPSGSTPNAATPMSGKTNGAVAVSLTFMSLFAALLF
jgi:hypothetical protein